MGPQLASDDVDVDVVAVSALLRLRGELGLVYRSAFAGPPWHEAEDGVARFMDRLRVHVDQPRFRAVVATVIRGRQVAGFAYGFTSFVGPSPGPWYGPLVEALGRERTERSLIGAFELVELAVASHHQGHGIGGRLHDSLIDHPSAHRAWLLTNPAAQGALALYRKRGWGELARPVLADRSEPRLVLARTAGDRRGAANRSGMGVGQHG